MNTVKERRAKVKRVLEEMTAEEVVEFAEELRLTSPDTEITESTVSRLKAMLHFFGSLPKPIPPRPIAQDVETRPSRRVA